MPHQVCCTLCGGDRTEALFTVEGCDIVRCSACGLVYTATQPTAEEILDIYAEDYFSGESEHGVDYMGDVRVSEYDRARFADTLDLLDRVVPGRGRLLDVGCATGNFLRSAVDRGWEASGAELSVDAARFARDAHGLDVFGGPLEDAPFAAGSFDAIVMNHVLEHVPEPSAFLRGVVAPLLAPGGVLLVEVPNFESVQSRVNRERWDDLRPRQHLYHFSPATLTSLLERSGYGVATVATFGEPRTSILGPLVYLGIAVNTADRGAAGRRALGASAPEGRIRPLLRRVSRAVSLPVSRACARRGRELRLVAVATTSATAVSEGANDAEEAAV